MRWHTAHRRRDRALERAGAGPSPRVRRSREQLARKRAMRRMRWELDHVPRGVDDDAVDALRYSLSAFVEATIVEPVRIYSHHRGLLDGLLIPPNFDDGPRLAMFIGENSRPTIEYQRGRPRRWPVDPVAYKRAYSGSFAPHSPDGQKITPEEIAKLVSRDLDQLAIDFYSEYFRPHSKQTELLHMLTGNYFLFPRDERAVSLKGWEYMRRSGMWIRELVRSQVLWTFLVRRRSDRLYVGRIERRRFEFFGACVDDDNRWYTPPFETAQAAAEHCELWLEAQSWAEGQG